MLLYRLRPTEEHLLGAARPLFTEPEDPAFGPAVRQLGAGLPAPSAGRRSAADGHRGRAQGFRGPVAVFASEEDAFFPARAVFARQPQAGGASPEESVDYELTFACCPPAGFLQPRPLGTLLRGSRYHSPTPLQPSPLPRHRGKALVSQESIVGVGSYHELPDRLCTKTQIVSPDVVVLSNPPSTNCVTDGFLVQGHRIPRKRLATVTGSGRYG
jgi:hypothetical protein